jgi:hypothetical protein
MKQLLFVVLTLSLFAVGCNRIKEKTKSVINKGGETVGESATEFFEGVSEGIDKTLQCEIQLSEELSVSGLKTGKYVIKNDTNSVNRNLLTIYLIFNNDFNRQLTVKAMDKNGLEFGRATKPIARKAGETGYYDFVFDKRTDIEVRSIIRIE